MSMPLRTIKSVSERYEFLKTQHDDLVEAEATLEKNLSQNWNEAMRKQFTEQFAHICQEFDHVFNAIVRRWKRYIGTDGR